MADRICTVDECSRKAHARGLCNAHYLRFKQGKPLDGPLRQHYYGSDCSVERCLRKASCRGLCGLHYKRWSSTGTTDDPPKTLEARFWLKVQKTEYCWNWIGTLNDQGYGIFLTDATTRVRAHRISYELLNGAVSDDVDVDHRCHNHRCVNPEHLRATTHKQNTENRAGPYANNKSGVLGVHWSVRRNRWIAQVTHNYRPHYVGSFTDLAEAEAAVIAKRNELFTHNDKDRVST